MVQEAHVVAITFPFSSHAAQMLNITRRLAAAAPNVTFSFINTANSNGSLFGSSDLEVCGRATGYDNIKVYEMEDGVPQGHVLNPRNPLEAIGLFLKATPNNLKKAIEEAVSKTGKKVTCVTNDAFLWMTGNIAEELGVTWVPVWAPGASSLSSHIYTNLIRDKIKNGWSKDEPLSFIPGMSKVCCSDLPAEVYEEAEITPFSRMLLMVGEMMPRATAVAINSFEELESSIVDDLKSKLKMCLTVGPLTMTSPTPSSSQSKEDDPHGCLSWLEGHKESSVSYVTLGTSATPPPPELAALAQGVEESGVPFLWSLKDRDKANLPDGFLERTSNRGKVVPWTPQSKVLQHPSIGVIVTHCGWNTVLEGIMCGIPIIYRPFFGDHTLIARFVSSVWQIGVSAGDGVFTKEGTLEGLNLILCQDQGKEMKQRAVALRNKARHAIGPEGSTTKNFTTLLDLVTKT